MSVLLGGFVGEGRLLSRSQLYSQDKASIFLQMPLLIIYFDFYKSMVQYLIFRAKKLMSSIVKIVKFWLRHPHVLRHDENDIWSAPAFAPYLGVLSYPSFDKA